VEFSENEFTQDADFSSFIFPGQALFKGSKFTKMARFRGARFHGEVNFAEAKFDGLVDFREAHFEQDFSMAGAVLKAGPLTLSESRFDGRSDFRAVTGNAALFAERATFDQLPDFHGAMFRTPRLDNVQLGAQFSRTKISQSARTGESTVHDPRPWLLRWMKAAVSSDVAAKYRVLKKMAVEGHDQERELEFAAQEHRARRFWVDRPFGGGAVRFWLGLIYDQLSNFGRSVLRPLSILALFTLLFT
jgi:hypothetical protein